MDKNVSGVKKELKSLQERMGANSSPGSGLNQEVSESKKNKVNWKNLEFIVNEGPAVAFFWPLSKSLPVEFVSENVKRFGYLPEDFYSGRVSYFSIIHKDDLQRVTEDIEKYGSDPDCEYISQQFCITTSTGEIKGIDARIWFIRSEEGKVTRYKSIILDITEIREIEERMKLQTEILDKIIAERTAALRDITKRLRNEIAEHRLTGEQLRERTLELTMLNNNYREETAIRRREENELRESRDQLELALKGANIGSWNWYIEADKINFDHRGLEIIGYKSDTGKIDFNELKQNVDKDYFDRIKKIVEKHFAGEISFVRTEYPFKAMSGDRKWVAIQGKIVEWDSKGRPLRMSGIVQDITDQIETERELKKTKEIDEISSKASKEFIDNLCYEMRTPLHSIQGFGSFGFDKYNSASREQLRDYFKEISKSGKKLLEFFDELLHFTRLKSGTLVYNFEPIDIFSLIDHVLDKYKENDNYKFMVHCFEEKDKNVSVICDREKLKKVLQNLVGVAVDFSPEDETIDLTVSWRNEMVRVTVLDRGPGILEEDLKSIFDTSCMFKGEDGIFRGKGFKLAVCKEIIEGHNGTIWAENYPEGGVQFIFEIPLNLSNKEPLERVSALAGEIDS